MTTGSWLLSGGLVLAVLAYWRLSLRVSTTIIIVMMIVATVFLHVSALALMIGWLVAAAMFALTLNSLRRTVISDRLLPLLRRAVPPMSQTEREALEAGTVWWDAELFSGRPDWRKLMQTPPPV